MNSARMPCRNSTTMTPLAKNETRRRVALFVGPRWRLSRMFTPLRPRLPRHPPGCGGERPATVSPQAPIELVRAAISPLPRACPVPHPKRCSLCGSRSPASARRGPLRSPPRLRPRSVGDRRPASRSSLGLALSGRPMRGPSRSAHAPPLCVGIRSGRPVVVAALLLRRSVARFALLPPVARPARARVLARALADFGGSAAAKIQRLNFNLHM